jgi:hypothetical protein
VDHAVTGKPVVTTAWRDLRIGAVAVEGNVQIIANFTNTSTTSARIKFTDANTGAENVNIGAVGTRMAMWTNNVERISILSGGSIGIGTTSPTTLLTLQGNGVSPLVFAAYSANPNADIFLQSSASTNAVRLRNGADDFQIFTNGSERMRIKSDGIINLSNVPSSSAGLSSGDIYKTAGVLMIV